jgi:hypothetical protein
MSSVTYPGTPLEARAEFPYALNFADKMLNLAGYIAEALAAPFASDPTSRINTMSRHTLEDIGLHQDQVNLDHLDSFWRL